MKKQITKKQWIIIAVAAALLLVLVGIFCFRPDNTPNTGEVSQNSENTNKKPGVTELINSVKGIKNEIRLLLRDIKNENMESARSRVAHISDTITAVRKPVDQAASILGTTVPVLKEIQKLLDTAEMAMGEILDPAIDLMEAYPLSQLKVGDGFNTRLVGHYIDFAESVLPKLEIVLAEVSAVDLSFLDSSGELAGYLEKANELVAFFRAKPELLPMIKAMLGAEEDRLYVLAVQSPAELRASGGFPGSIGTVRIQDGVLTLGDFKSVTYMFVGHKPKEIQITQEERQLFYHLSGIQTPRDADLCPDFERVGHIWALAYEEKNNEPVNGVISVTPRIVERLLTVMDKEIELSDGSIINGQNAMKVLQHDVYYKYFGKDSPSGGHTISDEIFAEAAEKTMKALMENMSLTDMMEYLTVAEESFEDRTLMLWMKDEAEQAFVVEKGWSGGLNRDPEKPQAGVYCNCVLASKMGWYVMMETVMGERSANADGSYTYPITVTFHNNATQEEIKTAGKYISGGLGGRIRIVAYFFAPAGGTVSNFVASNGQNIRLTTYDGMELGFMDQFLLNPDTPITVTYLVTTAPGVETPLTFSQTPTAQDYYEVYGVG